MLWLVSKTPPYPPTGMGKSKEGEEVSYLVSNPLSGGVQDRQSTEPHNYTLQGISLAHLER